MRTNLIRSFPLLLGSFLAAQVCPTGALQLQLDGLPPNPAGTQNTAVVQGICPGDKAATVFDIGGLPQPLQVFRAAALFAGPASCPFLGNPTQPGTARIEIYDGVTFNGLGQAQLGPMIYSSPAPFAMALNTVTTVDISMANVQPVSSRLVVAFEIVANPNENVPGFGCAGGYCASLATDSQLQSGSACSTTPGTNLLYDAAQGWWDVSRFQIGGQGWCGPAFNGNWVIRTCVGLPAGAYVGTGEDFTLVSGVGGQTPDGMVAKAVPIGQAVTLRMDSPGGTLDGSIALWVLDALPSVGPAPFPVAPGAWVGANFITAGPLLLSPGGASITLPIPVGSFGTTFLLQGALFSPLVANGLYATTNAHALWIY